jgi:hypothetical protein
MFKYVAGVVALFVAGIVAFMLWSVQQKREEHRAISALVSEASAGLTQTLKQPSPEIAAKLEAAGKALEALNVKRQKPYAEAADVYFVSARTLAQRQADVARLTRAADQSRAALAAHMRTPRGRGDAWIRTATELSRRMDTAHQDLLRMQEALIDLLRTLPDAEKPLAPFAGNAVLSDPALQDAALKRAQDDLKRAARELEVARRQQQ